MSYRLALLSPIPMVPNGSGYRTLDLWVRDLAAQVQAVGELVLFAPVVSRTPADWIDPMPVPVQIRCVDIDTLGTAALEAALAGCDVVQVPGNFSWRHSARARRCVSRRQTDVNEGKDARPPPNASATRRWRNAWTTTVPAAAGADIRPGCSCGGA